jgi:hypothetical protein
MIEENFKLSCTNGIHSYDQIDNSKFIKFKLSINRKGEITWKGPKARNESLICDKTDCGCRLHTFRWKNTKNNVNYYEIPKSASTTLRQMWNLKYSKSERILSFLKAILASGDDQFSIIFPNIIFKFIVISFLNKNLQKLNSKQEIKLKSSSNWIIIDDPIYTDGEILAIVRNPIDRLLSNWRMFTQQKYYSDWLHLKTGLEPKTIDVEHFLTIIERLNNHHWNSQINFLPFNKDNFNIDQLIKLEEISEYEDYLKSLSSGNTKLEKINTTNSNYNYTPSQAIKKRIKQLYKTDFEFFYPELL